MGRERPWCAGVAFGRWQKDPPTARNAARGEIGPMAGVGPVGAGGGAPLYLGRTEMMASSLHSRTRWSRWPSASARSRPRSRCCSARRPARGVSRAANQGARSPKRTQFGTQFGTVVQTGVQATARTKRREAKRKEMKLRILFENAQARLTRARAHARPRRPRRRDDGLDWSTLRPRLL